MQTIQIDHARALIEVRLGGFFDPEKANKTAGDVREAVRSLGERAGQHLTLYDVSQVEIAPGATITLLQKIFANAEFNPLSARRLAFFTPSALGRLQLKRLREARGDIGIFEDRPAAIEWLLAN